MNRKELDQEIVKLANLLQMLVNINKVLETTKDPKKIQEFNEEYRYRFLQARVKAQELDKVLDTFFQYEKDNNLPIDIRLRMVKNQIVNYI